MIKNYIIVSSTCSSTMYEQVDSIKYKNKMNPSQKFFKLLIEGMVNNNDIDINVNCVSIRSIHPTTSKVKFLKRDSDFEKNVSYSYISIINRKILVYLSTLINAFIEIKRIQKQYKKEECYILVDVLSICGVVTALFFSFIYKTKNCAVVTDLPHFVSAINKDIKNSKFRKIKDYFLNFLIKKFDSYCFLTESMNEINDSKPYIVIEGIASDKVNLKRTKENGDFTIIYAGGLYEKFGVKNLVDSVKYYKHVNIKLKIYGEGSLKDYIIKQSEKFENLSYGGLVSLEEIFELEQKVSLLINTRPTDDPFTKYSFPSKTIEYMSSGTPVLTTKLEGIPQEYAKYLYFINKNEETAVGIANRISEISEINMDDRTTFGQNAKNFVTQNKNKYAQGRKLISFLGEL